MAELLNFPKVNAKPSEPHAFLEHERTAELTQDAAARSLALDPQRSFIVEAPAGSGKTALLVQRFLNLLACAVDSPEEILAITFTRKATAELRERIFAELEAASKDLPLPRPPSAFEQTTRSLAGAVLVRDRERGWQLLANPRRLRVQTIDSLCIEIAGTLPLLSGSAGRSPVDDAFPLYREAARNTLLQLGGDDRPLHHALHTVLLHRDGSLANVESLLAEMLATREQWAELVPLDRASLSEEFLTEQVRLRLERTLEHIVCAGLNRALQSIPPAALAELAGLAHAYSGEPDYKGKPLPLRLCSDHPAPPAVEAEHLDRWRALIGLLLTKDCKWRKGFAINHIGVRLSKPDAERLAALVAEIQCEPLREALETVRCLPPARYPEDQWQHAKALFRLLLHALAELRLLFNETGECDFTEFSLAARLALHHAEGFVTAGWTLRHLLVDEVQDTSSAQYDLLTSLTRTWDGASQTLFLVGDPKQSIYLFRQARVERFLRILRDRALGDVPLQPLQLTANFRSRPALVTGFNEDFASLFVPPGAPLAADTADVPFVAALATRQAQASSGVHWHTRVEGAPAQDAHPSANVPAQALRPQLLPLSPRGPALSLAAVADEPLPPEQQDARAIRRIVERWRATPLPPERQVADARPARPWRIAVLAAARRHLAPIAAEFDRPGAPPIPYRAVNVNPLAERPEVLDALALTRALYHSADRTAWFAVLRAPWCGLGAADLLTLAAEGDAALTHATVPELVENRHTLLTPTGQSSLHRAWPLLKATLEVSNSNSLTVHIQSAWKTLGGDAALSMSERRNVDQFFALLRAVENAGVLDFRELNRRLDQLYAESSTVPDAVELMTIHSAKGLEWDVVIVPALGRQGQRESSRLLNWLELESGAEPSVLLAPIHGKGDEPGPLYRWLNRVHARRLAAERKRIFYVACTRAREELHLFATARQSGKGDQARLDGAPGSLLHACWTAAAPHFRPAAATLGFQRLTKQPADYAPEALTLAASAEPGSPTLSANPYLPRLTRLPLGFDPQERFRAASARRLPYALPARLLQGPPVRPEGSVAVRALGNVVHRFLELLALRLDSLAAAPGPAPTAARLRAELPAWLPRLTASLRAEGLPPPEALREAARALALLTATLADPVGLWLLSPQPDAASERPVVSAAGLLRVDRTFLAGPAPFAAADPHTPTRWIVDFKTTSPGGRSPEAFAKAQRALYGPQLARYAEALQAAASRADTGKAPGPSVQLGLYFPAIPRLLHWAAEDTLAVTIPGTAAAPLSQQTP